MRRNDLFLMANCFMVLALLLASCAPAAAPAPTPGPTTAPSRAETPAAKSPAVPVAPSPTARPTAEPAAGGRYGGTLLLNEFGDPATKDLHFEFTTVALHPLMPAYNGIVQFDPLDPDKVIGDLAEKWEVSADGKSYTFRFHKGIKWHDGRPFTADDAKFNLERMLDPKTMSGRAEYLRPIEKMETPDADTLRLSLRYAFNLVPLLAVGWMQILPKHVVEARGDMKKDVMGTGPFKHKEYAPGVLWNMERNNDYFIKGRPYLDGIITYIIKDPATRIAAFRTGQVHLTIAGAQALPRSAMESVVKTNSETVVHKFDSWAPTR